MKAPVKAVLVAAWFALLASALWNVSAVTVANSTRSYDLLSRPPLVRLDPRVISVATLGHAGLYEDVIVIWGLQALMDRRLSNFSPENIQKMVLEITHQGPRLETFYMLSCFTLSLFFHRPELCEPVILDGIRAMPQAWRLPMVQGWVEMDNLKNPKAAALYYGLAASRPMSPPYLKDLSNKLAVKGELSPEDLNDSLNQMINSKEGSQLQRLLRERTAPQ